MARQKSCVPGARAHAGSGPDRLAMGRPTPDAVGPRLGRTWSVSNGAHALHARDHGRLSPGEPGTADRVHEGSAGRRDGSGQQLDWLCDPSGAGADAGGPADGGIGETKLTSAD